MPEVIIATDDPRTNDVSALLEKHLEFARSCTPTNFVFALDKDELLQPDVTLFTARRNGTLLGVGALKELSPSHGEVKSMTLRSTPAIEESVGPWSSI